MGKTIDVTCAIIESEGKYLIARRRGGNFDKKWEFPGGKIERGETPEQCLRRELNEEHGIISVVGNLFGESIHDYEHKKIKLLSYLIKKFSGDFRLRVHDKVEWVFPHEMRNYDFCEADLPFVDKLCSLSYPLMVL